MVAATTMRRFGTIAPSGRGVVLPAFHQAVRSGRSIFPSRVFAPDEVARMLKSGHQSRKIGAFATKGRRKGWPIFTLTLEERATCPRSCGQWQSCYGNNMHGAERIDHRAQAAKGDSADQQPGEALEAGLAAELAQLAMAHPRGFMVRLHVLGDFASADYARFWGRMLAAQPALHLFGFTAHDPASEIGRVLSALALDFGWGRCAIRFSGAPHELRAARVLEQGERDDAAVPCPAQTGGTDCCGTCGLCWQSERSISFGRH